MQEFTEREISAFYRERVPEMRQGGREWRGPCPVHKGERDSFAVNSLTGFAMCHSQCGQGWDMIGLQQALTGQNFKTAKAEVFSIIGRGKDHRATRYPYRDKSGKQYRIEAEHTYTDENGRAVFVIERRRMADGTKEIKVRLPGERKMATWKRPPESNTLLYRLPRVLSANTVFVVEGEKDVETLEGWGLVATTNAFGAGKWKREHARQLEGKHVIVLPDNDNEGRKHCAAVVDSLLGIAASVRVVNVPGVPDKGDVTDWKLQFGGTKEKLLGLIESNEPECKAPEPATTPESDTSRRGEPGGTAKSGTEIAPAIPAGFHLDKTGVYKIRQGENPLWVCSQLEVLAHARSTDNENWSKQLRFPDREGVLHELLLPVALLAKDKGEVCAKLLNLGLRISAQKDAQNHLKEYIQTTEPSRYARTVERIGVV